ncbi:MAG: YdcF family protein [Pseudomonadota bacterium]
MGLIRRLLALAILAGGTGLAWTAYFIYAYADPEPIPSAAAIVVLSGPWTGPAEEKGETRIRVDRGVALYQAGLAPRMIMSGGGDRKRDGGPGDATFMAEYAAAAGVPREAIAIEPDSFSTLQNAHFSARLDGVEPTEPILLVTHRYHLSRANLSFRWAGFTDITPVASDPGAPVTITEQLLMEAVKWPLNAVRAAGASAALAFGVAEADVLPWLN